MSARARVALERESDSVRYAEQGFRNHALNRTQYPDGCCAGSRRGISMTCG
jgi:hypothetical protein